VKKLITLALALVLALSLAACGGNSGNSSTPSGNNGGSSTTTPPASQGGNNNGGSSVSWPSFSWVEDWMKKDDIGKIVEIDNNIDETVIFVTFENVSADDYEAYVAEMAKKGEHRLDEADSDIIECTGINVSQIHMEYEPFGEKEKMKVSFYK
jgi:ABC-type glycerol-3-phosphate transport system substrate-binding protein